MPTLQTKTLQSTVRWEILTQVQITYLWATSGLLLKLSSTETKGETSLDKPTTRANSSRSKLERLLRKIGYRWERTTVAWRRVEALFLITALLDHQRDSWTMPSRINHRRVMDKPRSTLEEQQPNHTSLKLWNNLTPTQDYRRDTTTSSLEWRTRLMLQREFTKKSNKRTTEI